jgi:hypothetical protein
LDLFSTSEIQLQISKHGLPTRMRATLTGLYDFEISLLEQVNYNFEFEFAGTVLAGRDARQLSSPAPLTRLSTLLTSDFMDMLAERIRASRWLLEPEQLPRIRTMLLTFSEHLLAYCSWIRGVLLRFSLEESWDSDSEIQVRDEGRYLLVRRTCTSTPVALIRNRNIAGLTPYSVHT